MRKLAAVAWVVASAPAAVFAVLLLVAAVTWRGHFFAIVGLCVLALPLVWLARFSRKGIVTGAVAVLIAVLGISAPRIPDSISWCSAAGR